MTGSQSPNRRKGDRRNGKDRRSAEVDRRREESRLAGSLLFSGQDEPPLGELLQSQPVERRSGNDRRVGERRVNAGRRESDREPPQP
jgi:hypothetical protein